MLSVLIIMNLFYVTNCITYSPDQCKLAVYMFALQAYMSRAAYFSQQGRYTKAILNCNEAISLRPDSVRAFVYRGCLKYKIGAFQLAENDLNRAIELESECRLAHYNRALCRHAMNDLQQVFNLYLLIIMSSNVNQCWKALT